MRLSIILVLAGAVSVVTAKPETNAQRLARGLPPLPPARRATPVDVARRTHPSGTHSCNTGHVQCCESVGTYNSEIASVLSDLLGVRIPVNIPVGISCSPISLVGSGRTSCHQQTVCCNNNGFNGRIAIGCSPINLH